MTCPPCTHSTSVPVETENSTWGGARAPVLAVIFISICFQLMGRCRKVLKVFGRNFAEVIYSLARDEELGRCSVVKVTFVEDLRLFDS